VSTEIQRDRYTSEMNDLIDSVCIRPEHQITTAIEALTMHEEKWAYCPSAKTDQHEWRSCGGMRLEDLKRFLQRFPAGQITAGG